MPETTPSKKGFSFQKRKCSIFVRLVNIILGNLTDPKCSIHLRPTFKRWLPFDIIYMGGTSQDLKSLKKLNFYFGFS